MPSSLHHGSSNLHIECVLLCKMPITIYCVPYCSSQMILPYHNILCIDLCNRCTWLLNIKVSQQGQNQTVPLRLLQLLPCLQFIFILLLFPFLFLHMLKLMMLRKVMLPSLILQWVLLTSMTLQQTMLMLVMFLLLMLQLMMLELILLPSVMLQWVLLQWVPFLSIIL